MLKKEDRVYSRLRRHLDRQAVGFPRSRSGAELRILKRIFSPREAEAATCLTYRFESLEVLSGRASEMGMDRSELSRHLDAVLAKGGIEAREVEGERQYRNIPFVVGIYELQLDRLSPEFIRDFRDYTSGLRFGLDFLGTELPQMRTIPVSRSIQAQHYVGTYDEVTRLVEQAEGPFVVLKCICREKASLEGHPCRITTREETCLGMGEAARSFLLSGKGREISREEVMEILLENEREGLVLQPSNSGRIEFICSCCGCCCGMLKIQRYLPRPLDFWSSNYFASVDPDRCNGCGTCRERCQVEAVRMEAGAKSSIDRNRCIGCGLCVTTCRREAVSLNPKPVRARIPETREELYEIISSGKKGPLGRAGLVGKLLLDSIRSRDFRLVLGRRH